VYPAGTSAAASSLNLLNVELASLSGGAGFNQFDVSQRRTPAAIHGGAGQDVILYRNDGNMVLTNNRLSVTGATNNFFELSGMDVAHLIGGAGSNTFTISQWAGSGIIDGGTGADRFNISSGNLDAVTGPWTIRGSTDAGDNVFLNDMLAGPGNYIVTPTSVTIAPGSFRRFGGVFFNTLTPTVQLAASNSANRIDITPSQFTEFTINGGPPSSGLFGDTLVVHTAFSGPPLSATGGRLKFQIHRDIVFADIEQILSAP
jgi:hypothetical protein